MSTLILSDLHIGGAGCADVLGLAKPRAILLERLADVERLVLLGDVLELRHGPRREAMAKARPFFQELGAAMAGREVIVLAGNHDHALVERWLAGRSELETAAALQSEQLFSAQEASSMLARLAEWAQPARLSAAYPGLWVRPDVYATHGHYLDCHLTLPTLERLGLAATGRVLGRSPAALHSADDYEMLVAPLYAWIDALARQAPTNAALNGQGTVRAWRALGGAGVSGSLRTRALAAGLPLAVAALNRAGLGPLSADISPAALSRAGLAAMGEVAQRLAPNAEHVVFGHTHRFGPIAGRPEHQDWVTRSDTRLINAGCWTYDYYFLTATPGESPYWPGGCVVVPDHGDPTASRLLDHLTHAELTGR